MPDLIDIKAIAAAKTELIEVSRTFYAKNWMLGTSGNLSHKLSGIKGELQYLITASGVDKGALTETDFVLVREGGELILSSPHKSSAETLLHEAIYHQFSEVTAVYHVHTPVSTVLSMQCRDSALIFEDQEMLKGLGAKTHDTRMSLPIMDNTQDITALSQTIGAQLQVNVPGLLLRGHGLYAWGKTPAEAKRHVEIWEFLFQVKLLSQRPSEPIQARKGLASLLGS